MTTTKVPRSSSFWKDCPEHEATKVVEDHDAYNMQAVELRPDVMRTESPPHQFLELCLHNPWDAAKRLACYWQLRVEVFGPEDAFKPIKDALVLEDVSFFPMRLEVGLALGQAHSNRGSFRVKSSSGARHACKSMVLKASGLPATVGNRMERDNSWAAMLPSIQQQVLSMDHSRIQYAGTTE